MPNASTAAASHAPARNRAQPRARHPVVDVAVDVHVHRVRAAGHQVAADEHRRARAPARAGRRRTSARSVVTSSSEMMRGLVSSDEVARERAAALRDARRRSRSLPPRRSPLGAAARVCRCAGARSARTHGPRDGRPRSRSAPGTPARTARSRCRRPSASCSERSPGGRCMPIIAAAITSCRKIRARTRCARRDARPALRRAAREAIMRPSRCRKSRNASTRCVSCTCMRRIAGSGFAPHSGNVGRRRRARDLRRESAQEHGESAIAAAPNAARSARSRACRQRAQLAPPSPPARITVAASAASRGVIATVQCATVAQRRIADAAP